MPFNNPIIRRMCTVASGTFCVIDIADAAIRGFKNKSKLGFLVRVNFVGLGRFAFACGSELRELLRFIRENNEAHGSSKLNNKLNIKIDIDPKLAIQLGRTALHVLLFGLNFIPYHDRTGI